MFAIQMLGGGMKRVATFAILVGALTLAACGDAEPPPPMDETMDMPMEEMEMDPAMMERHADEADEMAAEARAHIEEFRGLGPDEQHRRMADHTGMVGRMLGLMDRQMAEMSIGMPMDDEAMGAMMGMSGEEHRRMMRAMAELRSEAEELQVASVDALRERMPGHLERMEAMAQMMEEGAAAMRST